MTAMPTTRVFNAQPSFPDDMPIATLETISLMKLLAYDMLESEKLFGACRETGFFFLDMTDSEQGEIMLHHAEEAFDLDAAILDLDQEELSKYAFRPPSDLFG